MHIEYPELFSRIYGCEIAGGIANAFADKVESRSYRWVENRFGLLDRFVESREEENHTPHDFTYDQYRYRHTRVAGSTEDGFERHKLCALAIARKAGHIGVDDLTSTFVRHIDNTRFGYLLGWQDQFVYYSGRAMKKAAELGEFASWPGKIGTSKMIMPIGMINAGNPERAYNEAKDCARIKDASGVPGNYGIEVAGVIAASVAEALGEGATVDSVIDLALRYCVPGLREVVEDMLKLARSVSQWKDLREPYARKFEGKGESMADEILSAGLAVFWLARGNPRDAVIIASNIGRDTDCKAYVAAGLAGALCGVDSFPAEWVKTVEAEVQTNEYTLTRQTSWERACALYSVVVRDRGGNPERATGNLMSIVKEKLGLSPGAVLYPEHYASVVSLDIGDRGVISLAGVEKLVNLGWLKADHNQISDLGPLAGLTKLRYLDLGENQIRDLSPLKELKDLRSLFLCGNKIKDISILVGFVELGFLHLADNAIEEITALSTIETLESLNLDNNKVADLSPVRGNKKMLSLSVAGNRIADLAATASFRKIIALCADRNRLSSLGVLRGLGSTLKCLTVAGNKITDASALGDLTRLVHLDIGGNPIESLDFLPHLVCLGALDMDEVGCSPSVLPPSLRHVSAKMNGWKDLSSLAGVERLHFLDLSGNSVTDAQSLASHKYLKYLRLEGNALGNTDFLKELPLLESDGG